MLSRFWTFSTPSSVAVIWTTVVFTVATVGGAMVLGLLLATVLARPLRGRTFARATVFAPYVLSGVGIGLVWVFIFDPVTGVLGAVLRLGGGTSPEWFNDPSLSLVMVIIVYVWKNLGYCAVIYLAAIQAIPKDLLEAADIDGASRTRTFWSIVLPMARPALITLFILSFQGSWNELAHFIISTQSTSLTTLTKGVAQLASGQLGSGNRYPLKLAASVLMTIPVAVLFFVFQRRIMNASAGAVKE